MISNDDILYHLSCRESRNLARNKHDSRVFRPVISAVIHTLPRMASTAPKCHVAVSFRPERACLWRVRLAGPSRSLTVVGHAVYGAGQQDFFMMASIDLDNRLIRVIIGCSIRMRKFEVD